MAGGLTVIDAVEQLLVEHLEDSVIKALGHRLVKAPRAKVHLNYYPNRFENLFNLQRNGYSTWYPEVNFVTGKSDALTVSEVTASGVKLGYITYGGGVELAYKYKKKELKTQVNHTVCLNKVRIPAFIFSQARQFMGNEYEIEQPYIANLTVGFNNFVDDRIQGFRVVSFDHVITGTRVFCTCHQTAHASMLQDARQIVPRAVPGAWPHRVVALLECATYSDGLCHFCVADAHGEDAASDWYGAQIQDHYEPYVDLLVRSEDMDIQTAKAEARRRLSISRWKREGELYRLVSKLFPNQVIRREASPPWLGQQRIDIYLPELKLAIEHQGEQHYRPIERFGGEEAFAKVQERDKRKRALCQQNGVAVVDIRFDAPLTLPAIRSRLHRWIDLSRRSPI
jgi:hypothetical protein